MAGKEQQDLQLQHMKLQEEYIFPVNTVSNSELKRVKVVIHVPICSLPPHYLDKPSLLFRQIARCWQHYEYKLLLPLCEYQSGCEVLS